MALQYKYEILDVMPSYLLVSLHFQDKKCLSVFHFSGHLSRGRNQANVMAPAKLR